MRWRDSTDACWRCGTVIAGALVTGIKSDLPGNVIGTVMEPVYDTATGKHLLIPQRGHSRSLQQPGRLRAEPRAVVWNRIILADTFSLILDNLVGTDPAGYSGLEDGVDWYRCRAGRAWEPPGSDRIIIAGRDGLQDSGSQVGQEMSRRSMNIQPTLTERLGLPIRIIVNRDLVLRPYQLLFFYREVSR